MNSTNNTNSIPIIMAMKNPVNHNPARYDS